MELNDFFIIINSMDSCFKEILSRDEYLRLSNKLDDLCSGISTIFEDMQNYKRDYQIEKELNLKLCCKNEQLKQTVNALLNIIVGD